jgi:hypothetical protein
MWSGHDEKIAFEVHWQLTRVLAIAVGEAHTRLCDGVAKSEDALRLWKERILPRVDAVGREVKEFMIGIVRRRNLSPNDSP